MDKNTLRMTIIGIFTIIVGFIVAEIVSYNKEKTPIQKVETITYDFYGACDIIYLEITNDEYNVISEGRGLMSSPKTLDRALREVERWLLNCK